MVGRKEKQTPLQLENNEPHLNGGSKFRRKLSHGLAFISYPLSQRKVTPNHHSMSVPSLAMAQSHANDMARASHERDGSLSLLHKPPLPEQSAGAPTNATVFENEISTKNVDPDITPKAFPRSRTTSFIPRPVRTESGLSTTTEGSVKPRSPTAATDPIFHTVPSKIPTPSPPLTTRRISSPRQYLPQHATRLRHTRDVLFVGKYDVSPSRVSLRSRTTPNLVKLAGLPQPADCMALRETGLKRPDMPPTPQKPVLQENVPTNRRVTQRRSQIQEGTLKRESLAVPGAMPNRRSFGPGLSLSMVQSKQSDGATPPATAKRLNPQHLLQTPLTAKRIQPNVQESLLVSHAYSHPNSTAIAQPRLMGLKNAPTTPAVDNTAALPPLPRSNIEGDFQRKALGTPNGRGDVWRTSCALADHEVRSLPRSSTFHNFGKTWKAPSLVPPIPGRYRAPSLFDLSLRSKFDTVTPRKTRILRLFSFTNSIHSIPEEMAERGQNLIPGSWPSDAPSEAVIGNESNPPHPSSHSKPLERSIAVSPDPLKVCTSINIESASITDDETHYSSDLDRRTQSMAKHGCLDDTDMRQLLQVKNYMPTGYWAGRFSTLFDKWCNEATAAELNPNCQHRQTGPLGRCRYPDHENQAKCYIFAQLHDVCATAQAAESLWVCLFEGFMRSFQMTLTLVPGI